MNRAFRLGQPSTDRRGESVEIDQRIKPMERQPPIPLTDNLTVEDKTGGCTVVKVYRG
jgi:hypothetical protein